MKNRDTVLLLEIGPISTQEMDPDFPSVQGGFDVLFLSGRISKCCFSIGMLYIIQILNIYLGMLKDC